MDLSLFLLGWFGGLFLVFVFVAMDHEETSHARHYDALWRPTGYTVEPTGRVIKGSFGGAMLGACIWFVGFPTFCYFFELLPTLSDTEPTATVPDNRPAPVTEVKLDEETNQENTYEPRFFEPAPALGPFPSGELKNCLEYAVEKKRTAIHEVRKRLAMVTDDDVDGDPRVVEWENELKRTRDTPLQDFLPDLALRLGAVGRLLASVRVVRIVDGENFVVEFESQGNPVWVQGYSTIGLSPDKEMPIVDNMRVTGKVTYLDDSQNQITTYVVEPCVIDDLLAEYDSRLLDQISSESSTVEASRGESFRTWTDRTGKFHVNAAFVKLIAGTVTLERESGDQLQVRFDELSTADQEWIRGFAKSRRQNVHRRP